MEISSSGSVITIAGNIKSVLDFQKIKSHIDNIIQNHEKITIKIPDSISITSSLIGYFTKLVYKDEIKISIDIGDERLYNLLDELHLVSQFNARKA